MTPVCLSDLPQLDIEGHFQPEPLLKENHSLKHSSSKRVQDISPVPFTPVCPSGETRQILSLGSRVQQRAKCPGRITLGPWGLSQGSRLTAGNRRSPPGEQERRRPALCSRVPAPRAREAEASILETLCFHALCFFSKYVPAAPVD